MYRVIKIGEKEVEMVANAATVYRYKQIFHEDYFKRINSKDNDGYGNLEIFGRMGFVMAMQAQEKDLAKLNEESFFAWLEQFNPMDVNLAVDAIAKLLNGSSEGTSSPKKEAGQ